MCECRGDLQVLGEMCKPKYPTYVTSCDVCDYVICQRFSLVDISVFIICF